METRVHLIALMVLAVYTVALVLVVGRNMRAVRTYHACADVSHPLARAVAGLLTRSSASETSTLEATAAAFEGAHFRAVRVVVFDANGAVVLDTHDPVARRPAPPTAAQRELHAAAMEPTASTTRYIEDEASGETLLVHVASASSDRGHLVVTQARALE